MSAVIFNDYGLEKNRANGVNFFQPGEVIQCHVKTDEAEIWMIADQTYEEGARYHIGFGPDPESIGPAMNKAAALQVLRARLKR